MLQEMLWRDIITRLLIMSEIWKDIEGYEGYQVSNLGRVKSHKYGKERILRPRMNGGGYLEVDLCKEGKRKHFLIHRLVAQAFIPNPEGLPQVNHKDENKTNNLVDNIEYCTARYNVNYGTRNERGTKNRVQSGINNGTYDPELCGLDKKERKRLYMRKYRRRQKNKITA